ncbi:MAG: hypothetical protein HRU23_13510 [Gammaproteobacteria bacterium]|nr:hypothetical protein [Gammaproteobacteria bacterium]
MQFLAMLEPGLFALGGLLVITALAKYTLRTGDYQSIIRVMVNQLKDGFAMTEFKIYRLGVVLLIIALVIRFINQLFFPS